MRQRLKAEFEHPSRLAFHARDIFNDFTAQPALGLEHIIIVAVMKTVFVLANIFQDFCIFTHNTPNTPADDGPQRARPTTATVMESDLRFRGLFVLLANPVRALVFEMMTVVMLSRLML